MTRSDQGKLLGVLVVTALSLWCLFPSYQFYTMTPAQRAAMEPAKLAKLRKKAVHLGLDLQGGLQLLLEVDKSRLSPAEANAGALKFFCNSISASEGAKSPGGGATGTHSKAGHQ